MSYQILNDAKRNVGYKTVGSAWKCDKDGYGSESPDWKGTSWYRMMEPAGTQIPEYAVTNQYCGTSTTGSLKGAHHPTETGVAVDRKVCFGSCSNSWARNIKIMKCASYFLYYLPDVVHCNLRYCAV